MRHAGVKNAQCASLFCEKLPSPPLVMQLGRDRLITKSSPRNILLNDFLNLIVDHFSYYRGN